MTNASHRIRSSIDEYFADMDERYSLQFKVLEQTRGKIKVKRKLSAGFVLTMILILVVATALAVAIMSGKEFTQDVLAPTAAQDTSVKWSQEQSEELIRLAKENGITITDDILKQINSDEGAFKESLMRAFVKLQLGYYPASWSIEDQAWYDELLVLSGIKEERTRFVPSEDEITEQEALFYALEYIRAQFHPSYDLEDEQDYSLYVQYMLSEDDLGKPVKVWDIEYVATKEQNESYFVIVSSDGNINQNESYMSQGDDSISKTLPATPVTLDQLLSMIEENDYFTVENMASFASNYKTEIESLGDNSPKQYRILQALSKIPYSIPSATDISEKDALEIAQNQFLDLLGENTSKLELYKHTISYRVYDPQKPEWRVCYKIDLIENYPLFRDGTIPFGIVIYLDASNGEVLSTRELWDLDLYYYWCEFPDERDSERTVMQGIG